MVGTNAVAAFSLLEDINQLLKRYKNYKRDEAATENIVNNVLKNRETLKFAPPKVKGRMLYQMIEYKYLEFSDSNIIGKTNDSTRW